MGYGLNGIEPNGRREREKGLTSSGELILLSETVAELTLAASEIQTVVQYDKF